MKSRLRRNFLVAALAIAVGAAPALFLPGGAALAAPPITVGQVHVRQGESVDSLQLSVGYARVEGTVAGDARVGTGWLDVASSGRVTGDASVGTGLLTVEGSVAGNATVPTGEIDVRPSGSVAGDVEVSQSGTVNLSGSTGGNVVIHDRGRVRISGTVRGDVTVQVGEVDIDPNAQVDGRVHVVRGRVVGSSPDVRDVVVEQPLSAAEMNDLLEGVAGSDVGCVQVQVGPVSFCVEGPGTTALTGFSSGGAAAPVPPAERALPAPVSRLLSGLGTAAVLFVVGLVLEALFPRAAAGMRRGVEVEPWRSALVGFLTLLLAVPLMVVLVVSIVGIPLAVLVPFALMAILALGAAAVAHLSGELFHRRFWPDRPWHTIAELGAGVGLFYLVWQVPVLGPLATALAAMVGAGAVLVTRFGSGTPWFRRSAPSPGAS